MFSCLVFLFQILFHHMLMICSESWWPDKSGKVSFSLEESLMELYLFSIKIFQVSDTDLCQPVKVDPTYVYQSAVAW